MRGRSTATCPRRSTCGPACARSSPRAHRWKTPGAPIDQVTELKAALGAGPARLAWFEGVDTSSYGHLTPEALAAAGLSLSPVVEVEGGAIYRLSLPE